MNDNTTEIVRDLVVVGGGIAGCTAAMAASRLGLHVALVQNRPVLGGNASSEIGLLMGGADRDFPHVRESGIVEEIELTNRFYNHEVQWRNCLSDTLLENQVLDSGVDLYLNTHIHALKMDDSASIACVTGAQQATEKVFCFDAPLFIDATGDAHIAALAGAESMRGSEARDRFGEPLAPQESSPTKMGSTLMFRVKDIGRPVPFVRPDWADHFPEPDDLPVSIHDPDRPQLWIEYGARRDTIGDNMAIRERLLNILYGVWDHIKNHGDYGAENLVLGWVGSVPGKRESRRVIGDYILTQHDITDPKTHDDAVAYGGWPIDVHNPDGFYAKPDTEHGSSPPASNASTTGEGSNWVSSIMKWTDYTHLDKPYPIPFRCYYSRNISNLLIAGRSISTSHVAHGSTRLIRTCAAGAQAVGTAAYLCRKYNAVPRVVGQEHIRELQQTLLKHDAHIPDIINEDPEDMAPTARLEASSEFVDPESGCRYAARKVVSGLSRGTANDENLWMSDPMQGESPEWLKLIWQSRTKIGAVHLTFDTMIREQRFFDRPLLGPTPTCVSDFTVEYAGEEGRWHELDSVEGNFLRHRIVHTEPVLTSALRVRVDKTQGDAHARIYEIRVYAEK